MGRMIAVEFHMPVLVWVDIEEGEITQVVEHAELIDTTGRLIDENGESFEDKGAMEVATQIAESADWPVWERY